MASKYTKINRSISEFKNFLDYYYQEYEALYKNMNPREGWKIPYLENELYGIVENLHGNLYEGIYPKLTSDSPATDSEIISAFQGIYDYLELAEKLVFDKVFEGYGDSPIGLAETLIFDLFSKAKEKLSEVLKLAKADLATEQVQEDNTSDVVGIIVATQTELEAVRQLLDSNGIDEGFDKYDSNIYYSGSFIYNDKSVRVIVTKTHHQGLAAASNSSTKLLVKYRPKYVFMIGHQAGNFNLERTHKLGHILISEECVDYQQVEVIQRKGDEEIIEEKDRKISIAIDSWLKSKIESFCRNQTILNSIKDTYSDSSIFPDELKAYIGKTVSGNALMRSATRFNDIVQKNPGLIGLDMETFGFYYACKNTFTEYHPKFASIKSISDYGEHLFKYSEECKAPIVRQNYACYTSANFLYHLIETL